MDSETEKELHKQQEITLLQLKQAISRKLDSLKVFCLYWNNYYNRKMKVCLLKK